MVRANQGAPQPQLLAPEQLFHPDLYFQLEPFYTCGEHELRWLVQVWQETAAASEGLPLKMGHGQQLIPSLPCKWGYEGLCKPHLPEMYPGSQAGQKVSRAPPRAAQMSCFWQPAPHSTLFLCFLTYSTLCQLTHTLCYFNLLLFTDYSKFP